MLLLKKDLDVYFDRFGFRTDDIAEKLETFGTEYVDRTNKRSACLKIAKFLENWKDEQYESVRMLKCKNGYYQVSKRLLDPGDFGVSLNDLPYRLPGDLFAETADKKMLACFFIQ